MLAGHEAGDRVLDLEPVADHAEVLAAQDAVRRVHASKALRDYIVTLLHHTRDDHRVELGATPRAGLMLLRAAKARALLHGRDHALPDDVQELAKAVLAHRIMLVPEAAGVGRDEVVADAWRRRRRSREPGVRSALGCAALGLLLLLVAGTFDAEPSTSPARRCSCSARARRSGSPPARGARPCSAQLGTRCVIEEQPLSMRIEAPRDGSRCRQAGSTSRCCPSRCASAPAARRALRIEVTFGRRGRRVLPPPAVVLRDPFGLAQSVVTGGAPDELLVLPRIHPVQRHRGRGETSGAHARTPLTAAAETEIDGLRQHSEGRRPRASTGRPRQRRRDDGAQARRRGRLPAAGRARPARAATPEALDSAVRAAGSLAVHFAKRAGCGLLLPATAAPPTDRARPRWLAAGARPPRPAARGPRPGAERCTEPPRARGLRPARVVDRRRAGWAAHPAAACS